jgi:hypothetical protein
MYRILLFSSILLCISCQKKDTTDNATTSTEYFFDLKAFINSEIDRLNQLQPKVEKRIVLKGQSEVQQFDSLRYDQELSLFAGADINKASWIDKYQADTSYIDDQIEKIVYTAKDSDLRTQTLEIAFDQKIQVSEVHIITGNESMIANVRKEMYYWPQKGYRLLSAQSTSLSDPTKVEIEATFIK